MKEFIEKLIERLEEEVRSTREMQTIQCKGNDGYGTPLQSKLSGEICALLKVKNIVNQLAEEYSVSAKNAHTGGWIPCDKELPPQPKENPAFDNKALELYLVSDGYSDYPFRAFWNGKFFVDGFSSVDVIAWQPLPEPYQPKGE